MTDSNIDDKPFAVQDNDTCEACMFRYGGGVHEYESGIFRKKIRVYSEKGQCRKNAPYVVGLSTAQKAMTVTEWPEVNIWDWCGEFERNAK